MGLQNRRYTGLRRNAAEAGSSSLINVQSQPLQIARTSNFQGIYGPTWVPICRSWSVSCQNDWVWANDDQAERGFKKPLLDGGFVFAVMRRLLSLIDGLLIGIVIDDGQLRLNAKSNHAPVYYYYYHRRSPRRTSRRALADSQSSSLRVKDVGLRPTVYGGKNTTDELVESRSLDER